MKLRDDRRTENIEEREKLLEMKRRVKCQRTHQIKLLDKDNQ
jgi:hypothetical protein